jgi:tetratricopeptide (TPR) repeat protein
MPNPVSLRTLTTAWVAALCLALLPGCAGEKAPAKSPVAQALPSFVAAPEVPLPAPGPAIEAIFATLDQGRLIRAMKLSRAELESHPDDFPAIYARGVVLYLNARFGTARLLFEQVLAGGPTFSSSERVFFFYGLCLMRLGDGDLARESLQAHLQLAPGDGDTLSALGELALQEGNPDGALGLFLDAIKQLEAKQKTGVSTQSSRAKAQAGVGVALQQLNRPKQALGAMESSIALDPNQAQSYYVLSRLHMQLGHENQSLEAYNQFRRLNAGH